MTLRSVHYGTTLDLSQHSPALRAREVQIAYEEAIRNIARGLLEQQLVRVQVQHDVETRQVRISFDARIEQPRSGWLTAVGTVAAVTGTVGIPPRQSPLLENMGRMPAGTITFEGAECTEFRPAPGTPLTFRTTVAPEPAVPMPGCDCVDCRTARLRLTNRALEQAAVTQAQRVADGLAT